MTACPDGACIPAGMNRAERRAHKVQGHMWKTGDPADGQFCAVCGTSRMDSTQASGAASDPSGNAPS